MSNVLLPIFTNHRQMKISRSVTFNGRKAFRWWNLRFSFDTPSHSENTPWFCGKFSRDCFDSHKLWLVMNSNEWKSNHQFVSWCGHKSLYSKLKYLNQWSCHWIVGPVVLCDFILLGWAHFSVCIFLLDSLNRTHCVHMLVGGRVWMYAYDAPAHASQWLCFSMNEQENFHTMLRYGNQCEMSILRTHLDGTFRHTHLEHTETIFFWFWKCWCGGWYVSCTWFGLSYIDIALSLSLFQMEKIKAF